MNIEEKIKSLNLKLPEPPKPAGAYIPVVRAGSFIFTSGMLPIEAQKIKIKGKLGKEVNISQGYEAARICILNGLSAIKQEIGSLDKIKQVIRLNGYIQSEKGFTEQANVLNGASELLVSIFGEAGKHSRTAIGVSELPLNASVELDMTLGVEE